MLIAIKTMTHYNRVTAHVELVETVFAPLFEFLEMPYCYYGIFYSGY